MELLSKEILDQIAAARAKRLAAGEPQLETSDDDAEDEHYDPFRDNDVPLEPAPRGLFKPSW